MDKGRGCILTAHLMAFNRLPESFLFTYFKWAAPDDWFFQLFTHLKVL